jgi:hypothetical protein
MYIRCIYSILAGKSLNIRSYTVYIYGSGQPYKLALPLMPGELPIPKVGQNQTFIGIYGVLYGISGREITIHTVIYGVYIRFWPTLPIPYTVYIPFFWQGNHHTYGHIRCVYTVLANPTHTLTGGPANPHPQAMKPRDIQPNKRNIPKSADIGCVAMTQPACLLSAEHRLL